MPPVSAQNRKAIAVQLLTADDDYLSPQRVVTPPALVAVPGIPFSREARRYAPQAPATLSSGNCAILNRISNRPGKTRRSVEMMSLFTRRKVIGLFRLVGLAVPFKFSPLLAAETQAATNTSDVHLLSQDARPPPSVPLQDARLCAPASDRPRSDSNLPNVNWVRGNEARAEWTWAAQLADSPEAVPNNLGRYLVQIPGVLENSLIIPPVLSSTRRRSETEFRYRGSSTV